MTTAIPLTLHLLVLIGLYELAAGIAGLTGRLDWREMTDEFVRSPSLSFVTGFMVFAIGGVMIMNHHHWTDLLAVIVSLVGWIALVEGIADDDRVQAAAHLLPSPHWQPAGDLPVRRRVRNRPHRPWPHRPRRPHRFVREVTMADIPARTELKVTTGPIRGSRKIHVGPLGVAMRAVDLEPSCGEPPVVLYDTCGPYTDPDAPHRHHGRPARAAPRLDPRPRRRRGSRASARSAPRTTASSAPTARAASSPSPTSAAACCAPSRAPTSARCTMPAAASSRPRWNMSPTARISAAKPR